MKGNWLRSSRIILFLFFLFTTLTLNVCRSCVDVLTSLLAQTTQSCMYFCVDVLWATGYIKLSIHLTYLNGNKTEFISFDGQASLPLT